MEYGISAISAYSWRLYVGIVRISVSLPVFGRPMVLFVVMIVYCERDFLVAEDFGDDSE